MLLPGSSTASRNKLFFFWNQEFLPRTDPGTSQRRDVPTELERRGDFSQSFDNNGRLIVIRDPHDRPAVPGQHHPDESDRRQRAGAAEPVSGAERHRSRSASTTTRSRAPTSTRATTRCCASTGTSRPKTDVLLAPELRLRGLQGRLGLRAEQRQLAAAADCLRDPQLRRRQHAAAHVQPDARRRSDGRPQSRQADRRAAHAGRSASATIGTRSGSAGLPQFFPDANPDRASSRTPASASRAWRWHSTCRSRARRRGPLSVLRRERHLEQLGQPDQGRRARTTSRRACSSSTRRGRRRARASSTAPSTSTATPPTRSTPTIRTPTRSSGRSTATRRRPAHPDAQRAVHQRRVVRPGQLAREEELHDRRRHPLLPDRTDARARATSWPCSCPISSTPAQAPLLIQPISTPQGRARPQPGHRRDPAGGEDRHVRAELGQSVQRRPGVRRRACSTRRRSRWRRASAFSWDVTGDGKTAVRGGFGVFPDRFNDDIVLQHVELPPLVNTPTANYTTISELLSTPLSLSPAHGALAQSRLQAAVHLQLQHRRAARSRLEAGRRRRLRRLEGAQAAPDAQHQRGAVRHELPAVEHRPDDRRARCRPTSCGPYRGYGDILSQRVRRLLGLRRAADAGQPALLARPPLRPVLHARAWPRTSAAPPPNNNPTVNPFLDVRDRATTATSAGGTTWPSTTRTTCPDLSSKWDNALVARRLRQLADLGRDVGAQRRRRSPSATRSRASAT